MTREPSNPKSLNLSDIYRDQEAALLRQAEENRERELARLRDRFAAGEDNPGAYLDLAAAAGGEPGALDILREGLAHCRPNADLYRNFITHLMQANLTEEALEAIRRARAELPAAHFLDFAEALMLPILYETPEQIAACRERFSRGLRELIAGVRLDTPEACRAALEAIGWRTNFYLAYQGQDDRELQRQYGQWVHGIMAANYPDWVKPLAMPPLPHTGRIRVGYVSACLHRHSVAKTHLGWLTERDPNRTEVFTYYVGNEVDAFTGDARRASNHFYHFPGGMKRTCRAILADRLHVLVFLDVGMNPLMTKLAALRLAPVQCATWGHPVTTGLPTVDYFLSSQLMEPEDGQDYYTERLVRLPGVGVCYRKPVIPRALLIKPRSHYGLAEDRTVFWCGQSLFKYLPQHDSLFAALARRLPSAQFVFLASRPSLREDLLRRLTPAFAAQGLCAGDFCVMLPAQSFIDFWNLLAVSDVFLDSLDWNGCNTALEAIAGGLPMVTLPGRFMRGRHGYGILTQLGVTETLARDQQEYVDIAVRLAQDKPWRAQVVRDMKANEGRLFSRTEPVRALEDFYLSAVQERLPSPTNRSI